MKSTKAIILLVLLATLAISVATFVTPVKAQAQKLHVLTAHWSGIYDLIGREFEVWVEVTYGVTVDVEFESHDTVTCMKLVEAAAGSPAWSVWWGGGLDPFIRCEKEGLLESFYNDEIDAAIPAELFGLPLKDLDPEYETYNWWGSALSGFGVMVNTEYLDLYGLPAPKGWVELTDPIYRGHATLCAPSRSGSTHMIIEIILQYYGWEEGWRILQGIGANVGFFTEKSYHVPTYVEKGEYGIGLLIDFYGFGSAAAGYPVDFYYPPKDEIKKATVINPDCAAFLAGAPEPDLGKYFMEFILSYDGQKLLFRSPINRLPVRHDVYAEAPPGHPIDPFVTEMELMAYDADKGELRYDLINSLYDILITYHQAELKTAYDGYMILGPSLKARLSDAHDRIAEAEEAGYDVSAAKDDYDEAKAIFDALMLPVTEAEAEAIAEKFSTDATFAAETESEWTSATVETYALVAERSAEIESLIAHAMAVLEESIRGELERELETSMELLRSEVEELRTSLGGAQATMSELEGTVSDLRATISELQATIGTLNTMMTTAVILAIIGIIVGIVAYVRKPST